MILEPITDEHARDVCRIGQNAACCRYLTMSGGHKPGWSCEKHSALKHVIDARFDMVAKADNCEGRKSL